MLTALRNSRRDNTRVLQILRQRPNDHDSRLHTQFADLLRAKVDFVIHEGFAHKLPTEDDLALGGDFVSNAESLQQDIGDVCATCPLGVTDRFGVKQGFAKGRGR